MGGGLHALWTQGVTVGGCQEVMKRSEARAHHLSMSDSSRPFIVGCLWMVMRLVLCESEAMCFSSMSVSTGWPAWEKVAEGWLRLWFGVASLKA